MPDPSPASPRRHPMPKDPDSMNPFVQGFNPSGRRMLVLLSRGDDEVGIILTTTILGADRDGNVLTFTVREYTNEEMRLSAVVFNVAVGKMLTGDGSPCYFVVDDSSRQHVLEMKDVLVRRYPGAWLATV